MSEPRRVLTTGSRSYTDERSVRRALHRAMRTLGPDLTVVHGAHHSGADAIVDRVARQLRLPVERHYADWTLGRGAGPIRNERMIRSGADLVLAFYAGESKGTRDTVARAKKAGIPIREYGRRPNTVYVSRPRRAAGPAAPAPAR